VRGHNQRASSRPFVGSTPSGLCRLSEIRELRRTQFRHAMRRSFYLLLQPWLVNRTHPRGARAPGVGVWTATFKSTFAQDWLRALC